MVPPSADSLMLKRPHTAVREPDSDTPSKKSKNESTEGSSTTLVEVGVNPVVQGLNTQTAQSEMLKAKEEEQIRLQREFREVIEGQTKMMAYYFDAFGQHLQVQTRAMIDYQRQNQSNSRFSSPIPTGFSGLRMDQNDGPPGTLLGIPPLLPVADVLKSIAEGVPLPVAPRSAGSSSLDNLPPLGSPPPMPPSHSR